MTNIEGLHGYLAFSVFLHHAIITRHYLTMGEWEAPTLHASTMLGEGGVTLFFLITAFLWALARLGSFRNAGHQWGREPLVCR